MKRAVFGECGLAGAAVLMFAGLLLLPADASPVATPAATPPPGLDIQVTPSRPSLTGKDQLKVFIVVKNKANTPVTNLRVSVQNDEFLLVEKPFFPSPVAGFGSAEGTAIIQAKPSAQFVQHQVLFTFTYTANVDGRDVEVIQGSPIALQVTRRFDEESKGFLGGNAAFLYLLLPIIPLFLGYQLIDHRATGGRFEFPSFKTDYLVPVFLLAVLLNLVLLLVFRWLNADYSDPPVMLAILVGSFALGMAVAFLKWLVHYLSLLPWTFRESDSAAEYLRKALLRPGAPKTHEWVEGHDSEGEQWEGILLKQPSGAYALGATFQIVPAGQKPTREQLKRDVFDANSTLRNDRPSRKRLVELLKSGALNATYLKKVQQGGGQKDTPVVTKLDGFQRTPAQQPTWEQLVLLVN